MTTDLTELLLKQGPMMSGDLAAQLAQHGGLTTSYARKIIQRRPPPIRALDLSFPKRAQFLYHERHYGSPKFWRVLAEALVENNGAYARAIWALGARKGVIPVGHFASAAGLSDGRKQLSASVVLARLTDARLLQTIELPGLGTCVAFGEAASYLDDRLPEIRARLIAERVLLCSVRDWAARLGLGAFTNFRLRDESDVVPPAVSTFQWDMSAPSYVGALANWASGTPKPGFLVADVLLKDCVQADDVKPFLYKCEALRHQRGLGRCLQFFVAHHYSGEALNALRRGGVVPATTESLFGTDVAEGLKELAATLTQAAKHAVDPLKFAELFERLSKREGVALSLRGSLFEFIVADTVRKTVPNADITMNKIYRQGGKDVAEVDVRVVQKDNEIHFIECKGVLPDNAVSDDDVGRWLKKIAIVRRQTLDNAELGGLKQSFQLWTTGSLSEEAKRQVAKAQDVDPKKYKVDVLYAKDILGMMSRDKALKRVFKQFFIEHPMSPSDGRPEPLSKRRFSDKRPPDEGVFESLANDFEVPF